jgi:hypothetical protein
VPALGGPRRGVRPVAKPDDMGSQEKLSRRMTLLFLGALVLTAGQALRIPPIQPLPFVHAWRAGEQVLPVAVPAGDAPVPVILARSSVERLRERSIEWNLSPPQAGLPCEIFLHISRHHWARLAVSRERLAELLGAEPPSDTGRSVILGVSSRDLFEDCDGDGDPLDPGDLRPLPAGVEVRLYCAAEGAKE